VLAPTAQVGAGGAAAGSGSAAHAAKERIEEIGEASGARPEGCPAAEDFVQLLGGDVAVGIAARPGAERRPGERIPLAAGALVLLVGLPVGPELVVLLALLGVAEHLVGLIDFL